VPGLRDRSRARSDSTRGQGSEALATWWAQLPASDPKHRAKGSERDESFSLGRVVLPAPGGRCREDASGVPTAPMLIWFRKALAPTHCSDLYHNLYTSLQGATIRLFGGCPLSSSVIIPVTHPAELLCRCVTAWRVAAGPGHRPLLSHGSKEGSRQMLRTQSSASV